MGSANHAGGYSYRLCRIDHGDIAHIEEECFQKNQLDFVGDTQHVQYGKDRTSGQRCLHSRLQREHFHQDPCGELTHSCHMGRREVAVTMDTATSMMKFEYQNTWSPGSMSFLSGGTVSAALRCGHLVLILELYKHLVLILELDKHLVLILELYKHHVMILEFY